MTSAKITVLPRTRTTLLAGVLFALAGTSFAQPPRPPIDVATLEARSVEAFSLADADSDGLLTEEEFSSLERPDRSKRGPGGHKYHGRGGRSSDPEAQQNAADAMFDILDNNADDSLSREEFSMANQQAARKTLGSQRAFSRLDANADGVLTIEELPANRLATRDTDGDGTITQEELKRGRPNRNSNES
jgi:hypothetical protein